MEKYKDILEKILEKTGEHAGYLLNVWNGLTDYDVFIANQWLRGVLLSPETAKVFFGKGEINTGLCWHHNFNHEPQIKISYQYYLQQLVLLETVEEILEYYKKHL